MLICCQYTDFFWFTRLVIISLVLRGWSPMDEPRICFSAQFEPFLNKWNLKMIHRGTYSLNVDRIPILFNWCFADIHRWMNRIRICCCHLNFFLCLGLLKNFCCYTHVIMCQYKNWFSSLDWLFRFLILIHDWLLPHSFFLWMSLETTSMMINIQIPMDDLEIDFWVLRQFFQTCVFFIIY